MKNKNNLNILNLIYPLAAFSIFVCGCAKNVSKNNTKNNSSVSNNFHHNENDKNPIEAEIKIPSDRNKFLINENNEIIKMIEEKKKELAKLKEENKKVNFEISNLKEQNKNELKKKQSLLENNVNLKKNIEDNNKKIEELLKNKNLLEDKIKNMKEEINKVESTNNELQNKLNELNEKKRNDEVKNTNTKKNKDAEIKSLESKLEELKKQKKENDGIITEKEKLLKKELDELDSKINEDEKNIKYKKEKPEKKNESDTDINQLIEIKSNFASLTYLYENRNDMVKHMIWLKKNIEENLKKTIKNVKELYSFPESMNQSVEWLTSFEKKPNLLIILKTTTSKFLGIFAEDSFNGKKEEGDKNAFIFSLSKEKFLKKNGNTKTYQGSSEDMLRMGKEFFLTSENKIKMIIGGDYNISYNLKDGSNINTNSFIGEDVDDILIKEYMICQVDFEEEKMKEK